MVLVVVEAVEAVEVVVEVEMSPCFCEKGLGWGMFCLYSTYRAEGIGFRVKGEGEWGRQTGFEMQGPPLRPIHGRISLGVSFEQAITP